MRRVPPAPEAVKGVPLSAQASTYLGRLISELYTYDTMRPAALIVDQAVGIFIEKAIVVDNLYELRTNLFEGSLSSS